MIRNDQLLILAQDCGIKHLSSVSGLSETDALRSFFEAALKDE